MTKSTTTTMSRSPLKISKKKLIKALEYVGFINRNKLEDLDMSEFFEGDLTEAINAFHFTGLNNVDFLTGDFIFRQRRRNRYD